jgi:hypothetical protein
MDANEALAERFDEHRFRLRAVAYRLPGSLSEADAAVQEAWLRLSGRRCAATAHMSAELVLSSDTWQPGRRDAMSGAVQSDPSSSLRLTLSLGWWRLPRTARPSALPNDMTSPRQESSLARTWRIRRHSVLQPDGDRRRDQAYQLLVRRAAQPMQEVSGCASPWMPASRPSARRQ